MIQTKQINWRTSAYGTFSGASKHSERSSRAFQSALPRTPSGAPGRCTQALKAPEIFQGILGFHYNMKIKNRLSNFSSGVPPRFWYQVLDFRAIQYIKAEYSLDLT